MNEPAPSDGGAGTLAMIEGGMNVVAGHLQEKKGYFYVVLSYKDEMNQRKTKWIATGLPVKGNKKKADAFLQEQRRSFIPPTKQEEEDGDELFADVIVANLRIEIKDLQRKTERKSKRVRDTSLWKFHHTDGREV